MPIDESLLSLAILLLTLVVAGYFALKINQSLTAVFIITGVILQNFIQPTAVIEFIAKLGVIFMLFLFGLEFSIGSLVRNQRTIFITGLYDLFFNFPVGIFAGWVMGYNLTCSLMLGGIIYVTSSVIVAKSIFDLKRSANPETEYILSVLVFEDIFITVFLACIIGIVHYGHIDTPGVLLVILKTLMFFMLFIILTRYSKKYLNNLLSIDNREVFVILVLSMVVLSASAAVTIGLSEAIGAFLAGLLLSETEQRGRISEVVIPFQQFSTAIFFVVFGMSIEYKYIGSMIPLALVLFVASSLTKLFGGYIIGRRYRLSKKAGMRLGFSLIPRGEFSIILASTIAVNSHISYPLKVLAGVYVLLSAIAGSAIMKESDRFINLFFRKKETEAKQGSMEKE